MRRNLDKVGITIQAFGLATAVVGAIGTHMALNRNPGEDAALRSGFLNPLFLGFFIIFFGQSVLFDFPATKDGNWTEEINHKLKKLDRERWFLLTAFVLILSVVARVGFPATHR